MVLRGEVGVGASVGARVAGTSRGGGKPAPLDGAVGVGESAGV